MPNYFENIIGQEKVCKLLTSQIEAKNTSHAYLFAGPGGSGKFDCAKAFAKALEADVMTYTPQGVQTYLISQIKEIVKDSNLAPIKGKCKVYIIQNAEHLGTSAANAFLKTLEEPSDKVCFILLTNNANNVLDTIASRCQLLEFKQLSNDLAVKTVIECCACAEQDAQLALDLFGGNIEKACEFCLDQNLQDLHSEVVSAAENLENEEDWDVLLRSGDIISKIKEIVEAYKTQLNDKTKELSDVLEHAGLSALEEQNKRSVNSKQKELLYFFCSSLSQYYRDLLLDEQNQEKYLSRLTCLSDFEQNLAYNISPQNFCDVVLLKLKRI